jgi:hypothetical protein
MKELEERRRTTTAIGQSEPGAAWRLLYVVNSSRIAFGNQTIYGLIEPPRRLNGFASLPRDRFALIVAIAAKDLVAFTLNKPRID